LEGRKVKLGRKKGNNQDKKIVKPPEERKIVGKAETKICS